MYVRSKARPSRRAKLGLASALVVALAAFFIPQIGTASASEGNQDPACAGTDHIAEGKLDAFTTFEAYLNDKKIPSNERVINDYVKQGDTVKVKFQLTKECSGTYVGISAYEATSANDSTASEYAAQKLVDRDADTYTSAKEHTISITVPSCYYQIDVNTGGPYKPGDFTYDRQGRLLLAAQGGKDGNCKVTTTTKKPTTTTTAKPTTTTTEKPTTTTTEKPTTTTSTSTTVVTPTTITEIHAASVDFTKVCVVNGSGFKGALYNNGNTDESFDVYVNGKKVDTVSLKAYESTLKTWTFADLEIANGATASVKVKTQDKTVASTTITNDCFNSSATIAAACDTAAGRGAVITLTNTGTVDESYRVYRDGTEVAGSPVTVSVHGTAVQKLLAMNEDETATIHVVSASGSVDVTKKVTVDCEAPTTTAAPTTTTTAVPVQVLDEQIDRPQLAYTGVDVKDWVFGGLLLLGIGFAFTSRAARLRKLREYNA